MNPKPIKKTYKVHPKKPKQVATPGAIIPSKKSKMTSKNGSIQVGIWTSSVNKEQKDKFRKLVKPLIKWLCKNGDPHTQIVIEMDSARVYSGEFSISTEEFIED